MSRNKGGRPKIEIDLQQLEALAAMQCTDEELAAVLGCSIDTIKRRKKDKDKTGFVQTYINGKAKGKASLRRLQWEAAKKGNITMMIWLGKQLLNQHDKIEQEHSGLDGGAIEIKNQINYDERARLARERLIRELGGIGTE